MYGSIVLITATSAMCLLVHFVQYASRLVLQYLFLGKRSRYQASGSCSTYDNSPSIWYLVLVLCSLYHTSSKMHTVLQVPSTPVLVVPAVIRKVCMGVKNVLLRSCELSRRMLVYTSPLSSYCSMHMNESTCAEGWSTSSFYICMHTSIYT